MDKETYMCKKVWRPLLSILTYLAKISYMIDQTEYYCDLK